MKKLFIVAIFQAEDGEYVANIHSLADDQLTSVRDNSFGVLTAKLKRKLRPKYRQVREIAAPIPILQPRSGYARFRAWLKSLAKEVRHA